MPPSESVEGDATPKGPGETLEDFVVRLARAKAADVMAARPGHTILACDTLSEVDGVPLGKPKDRGDARSMLVALSGRRHRVVSGVCLWRTSSVGSPLTGHAESWLVMPPLDDDFIRRYLDTGLWQGKAGACGFQDGHIPLELVSGSASNVVGLPVELVRQLLQHP